MPDLQDGSTVGRKGGMAEACQVRRLELKKTDGMLKVEIERLKGKKKGERRIDI